VVARTKVGVTAAPTRDAGRSFIYQPLRENQERNHMNTNEDIDLLDLETIENNLKTEDVKDLDDESLHASASAFMIT
jgi:hypothetical protein